MQKLKGKLTDITVSHTFKTNKTTLNIYDYLEIDSVRYGNVQVPDVINRHLVDGVGKEFELDYLEVKDGKNLKRTIVGITTENGKYDHIPDIELKGDLTAISTLYNIRTFMYFMIWFIVGGLLSLYLNFKTKSDVAAYALLIVGFIVIFIFSTKEKKRKVVPIKEILEYVKQRKKQSDIR
ncbi:hypothetical protein PNIG_p0018 (plasmid) [Pseudoalteromonas nigrifaciens]|uniref:Uncharacterized protein n=1 Tax=Pseudoalteromonas nigrifaciens TaxID=28109 RepID=A0AAC9UMN2_9GAMM|nr:MULTISPECIES: hypothetical protein [Pseudoalteromonas]ASM56301.1 hypothetical protein PNIG_p0018 [Pseudoalteromonas nigrifaciens]MBH0094573.1 hypothetical protein [Pseudoalteromonas sp. SCQQ13]GEN43302.1 hypothetical protein PNI02_27680 [Pseudoalteromonas nigrifaciens]SUD25067.1 Uncharacterised protein [Pseudoalteromonas nigrifaciens]